MRLSSRLREIKPIIELATAVAGFVAAVLLGVMGIMLSPAANRIAASQLELAERQTIVAEHQLEPRFRLEEEALPDQKATLLRLFNDGAPIEWFSIEQISFIGLDWYGEGTRETRLVPTYYYGDRVYTGSMTGLLATLSPSWLMITGETKSSSERLLELEEALQSWRPDITLNLRPFIVIHYTDSLSRTQDATYEVRPDYGGFFGPYIPRRLSESRTTAVRNLFGPMPLQPLHMLTGEMVREKWDTYPRSEKLHYPIPADGVYPLARAGGLRRRSAHEPFGCPDLVIVNIRSGGLDGA